MAVWRSSSRSRSWYCEPARLVALTVLATTLVLSSAPALLAHGAAVGRLARRRPRAASSVGSDGSDKADAGIRTVGAEPGLSDGGARRPGGEVPASARVREWHTRDVLGVQRTHWGSDGPRGPRCNMRVITDAEAAAMTPQQWRDEVEGQQPVVFRHHPNLATARDGRASVSVDGVVASAGPHAWRPHGWPGVLSRESLTTTFRDVPVHVCAPVGEPMEGCVLTRLGEWVERFPELTQVVNATSRADEVRYLFNSGGTLEENFPELLRATPPSSRSNHGASSERDRDHGFGTAPGPPELLARVYGPEQTCHASQLAIGHPGSGVPFHWHTTVHANSVIAGRKRWFVSRDMPPGGFNPRRTSLSWLREEYPRVAANGSAHDEWLWECTLGEGDVLHLPGGFYHSTLNVGETVSVTYTCSDGPPGHRSVSGASVDRQDVPYVVNSLTAPEAQLRYLEGARRHDPAEPLLAFFTAVALHRTGRHKAAYNAVESALALNPLDARAHALAARLASTMAAVASSRVAGSSDGDRTRAVAAHYTARALWHWQQSVDLDPNHVQRCLALADALLHSGNSTAARARYARCAEVAARLLRLDLDPVTNAQALIHLRTSMDELEDMELDRHGDAAARDDRSSGAGAVAMGGADTVDVVTVAAAMQAAKAQYARAVEEVARSAGIGQLRKHLPAMSAPTITVASKPATGEAGAA